MKTTDILVWTRGVALLLTGVVACGGNSSSADPEQERMAAAGGTSHSNVGGKPAAGGQIDAQGGRVGTTRAAPNSTCNSLSISVGSRCPAVEQCMNHGCSSQITTCYGDADASGSRTGGLCQAYTSCVESCSCESACVRNCASQQDQLCRDCTSAILECVQSSCANETSACVATVLGGTAGAPGIMRPSGVAGSLGVAGSGNTDRHTCVELQACCARLTGSAQTNCQTYYATAVTYGDSGCNLAWRGLGC